jgi:hypothetical protein
MKLLASLLLALPAFAQSPDPMPGAPVVACRVVAGIQDVISLRQSVFGGSPQAVSCSLQLLQLPTIAASISPSGNTVSFVCTNLAFLPQLANVTCPGPITIPASVTSWQSWPAAPAEVDLNSWGVLHVSGIPASWCSTPCTSDGSWGPAPGAYAIAQFSIWPTVAGAAPAFQGPLQTLWTGAPQVATVQVFGCDAGVTLTVGYTVTQSPAGTVVTCQ